MTDSGLFEISNLRENNFSLKKPVYDWLLIGGGGKI
tara:strand:+ start:1155 stop:1262 length:108 start_codon:yes stop_codon:yes gene_type:complete